MIKTYANIPTLSVGIALRLTEHWGAFPPLPSDQGLIARAYRAQGANVTARAAAIRRIPRPVSLMERLSQAMPRSIATKPPAKPSAAPRPSPALSGPAAWQTPPRATQAPAKQTATIDQRMKRAEFDRLNPEARGKFIKEGGRIRD